jgi:hypothetical protein
MFEMEMSKKGDEWAYTPGLADVPLDSTLKIRSQMFDRPSKIAVLGGRIEPLSKQRFWKPEQSVA